MYIGGSVVTLIFGRFIHLLAYILLNWRHKGSYLFSDADILKSYYALCYLGDVFVFIGLAILGTGLSVTFKNSISAKVLKYVSILFTYCKIIRFSFNFVSGFEISNYEYALYFVLLIAVTFRALRQIRKT